jgi:S-methylmethionine-dependent homocysteine/selenocysteine methylase
VAPIPLERFTTDMTTTIKPTLLDGGMGRQLSRMGAPFRLPEWSALALIQAPEYVRRAHDAFVASGADVVTTNSYGLVPHMIGKSRFASEGAALASLAGQLARESAWAGQRRVSVAGSLPPTTPSYRPNLFEPVRASETLRVLVEAMTPFVDLWLIETQSSTREALTAFEIAKSTKLPVWVSYTLRDEVSWRGPAQLRSGELVEDAVQVTLEAGAAAVLFNCSQPEVMAAAVRAAQPAADGGRRIGVYANAFVPEPPGDEPYAGISELRVDLTPARYLALVQEWIGLGASIVGGCCGIGPEHIAALRAGLDKSARR